MQLSRVAYWVSELMLVCYYTCADGHALTTVGPPIISIVNIKRVETVRPWYGEVGPPDRSLGFRVISVD